MPFRIWAEIIWLRNKNFLVSPPHLTTSCFTYFICSETPLTWKWKTLKQLSFYDTTQPKSEDSWSIITSRMTLPEHALQIMLLSKVLWLWFRWLFIISVSQTVLRVTFCSWFLHQPLTQSPKKNKTTVVSHKTNFLVFLHCLTVESLAKQES